jgi:hypothetical protein
VIDVFKDFLYTLRSFIDFTNAIDSYLYEINKKPQKKTLLNNERVASIGLKAKNVIYMKTFILAGMNE